MLPLKLVEWEQKLFAFYPRLRHAVLYLKKKKKHIWLLPVMAKELLSCCLRHHVDHSGVIWGWCNYHASEAGC